MKQSEIVILMGDFNAKVEDVNLDLKNVMGRHGLGTRNENGDKFIDLCVNYILVTGGSLFPHKDTQGHMGGPKSAHLQPNRSYRH